MMVHISISAVVIKKVAVEDLDMMAVVFIMIRLELYHTLTGIHQVTHLGQLEVIVIKIISKPKKEKGAYKSSLFYL